MSHPRNPARLTGLGLTAIATSVLLLAACGGGGTASTSAPTATYQSAYAAGPIAGFGSIVINGVHYDETNASVTDDDNVNHLSTDLKLGMVAEVQAQDFGDTNNVKTATAQSITISRLLRGPVGSVGTDTLVMFGQTVKLTATTVFDDSLSGGLAAIKAGDVVTVYGTLDTATGIYTATRVEPQPGAAYFGLRASVTAIDSVAHTISIGSGASATLIDVSTATLPAGGLQAGGLVRIKLQTTQVNGKWVAVSVKSGLQAPRDVEHSEIEGTITASWRGITSASCAPSERERNTMRSSSAAMSSSWSRIDTPNGAVRVSSPSRVSDQSSRSIEVAARSRSRTPLRRSRRPR